MADVYENIVIGNFLVGFGIGVGLLHSSAPIEPLGVNLLQQTPMDKSTCDLVIGGARIFRLIEFKRRRNRSKKEKDKRIAIEDMAKLRLIEEGLRLSHFTSLLTLSRKIHWYVETEYDGVGMVSYVTPYLDFLSIERSHRRDELPEFINLTAKQAATSVVTQDEMDDCYRYLEWVSKWAGLSSAEDENNSGALLLHVTSEGRVNYSVVDSLRKLITPRRLILERNLGLERDLSLERSIVEEIKIDRDGLRLERGLRPERGRGLSM